MKQFLVSFVAFLCLATGISHAQISRSEWTFGPVIQTDNLVYSNVVGPIIPAIPAIIVSAVKGEGMEGLDNFYDSNKWWYPLFRYRANVVQDLSVNNKKLTLFPKAWGLSGWDWSFDNYSVGYHFGYLSRLTPFGFDVELDYVQDGYKYKYEDSKKKEKMIKRMITGTALLKLRLLKYDSNAFNPVIEIGGAYNQALSYKDHMLNDKNAVNSGFSGIIGLGYTGTDSHISWSVRYEHAFYNFYNKHFMYNGEAIFKDSKSKFGRLGFALSYGF